jgi:hypothetical protein
VAESEQALLSIAVVGGGATGVGLAAEIRHALEAFTCYSREHLIQGLSARWLYAMLERQHEFVILSCRRGLTPMLSDQLDRHYEPVLKLH